jgi:cell division protein FtsB
MVVKRRLSRFLAPLFVCLVSCGLSVYFIHHAHSGNRGMETKEALTEQAALLERELAALKSERAEWERRVALFRAEHIDQDLLEERSRTVLGRVHRNDVVIMGEGR